VQIFNFAVIAGANFLLGGKKQTSAPAKVRSLSAKLVLGCF
jgi:hypothetical protein